MEEKTNKHEQEDIEFVSEESGVDNRIVKLKKDLEACRRDKEEYLQGWQRAKADYNNLDRLSLQRQESQIVNVREKIAKELLDLMDGFDQAFKADVPDSPWVQGMRNMHDKLAGILKKNDITVIDALGKKFDPHMHEALELAETTQQEQDDMVIGEFQKGYSMNGRVLRPSKVKVAHFKGVE